MCTIAGTLPESMCTSSAWSQYDIINTAICHPSCFYDVIGGFPCTATPTYLPTAAPTGPPPPVEAIAISTIVFFVAMFCFCFCIGLYKVRKSGRIEWSLPPGQADLENGFSSGDIVFNVIAMKSDIAGDHPHSDVAQVENFIDKTPDGIA